MLAFALPVAGSVFFFKKKVIKQLLLFRNLVMTSIIFFLLDTSFDVQKVELVCL